MALDIDTVFRDNVIKGDIHSGANEPDKAEIRTLLKTLAGSSAAPAVVKQTKAALDAVTPVSETYGGLVLNDPDPANNGYYYRDSAAWVKGRGFPDTFAQITLGGTANAQTGAVAASVNPADALIYFASVSTENTGPMTLSISGETARDVVNLAGNPLSAGEWTGVVMFFLNEDGDYQLLIDAGAAASAAASASAAGEDRIAAELAREQAQAAASSVSPTEFPNIATAETLTPVSAPDFIRTAGYTTTGDGGGALYKKPIPNIEPDHAGKFSITLSDGVTVVWYELAEKAVTRRMFGARCDWDGTTGTDDTAAIQAMIDFCAPFEWAGSVAATKAQMEEGRAVRAEAVPDFGYARITQPLKINPFLSWRGATKGGFFYGGGTDIVADFDDPDGYALDAAPFDSTGTRVLGAEWDGTDFDSDDITGCPGWQLEYIGVSVAPGRTIKGLINRTGSMQSAVRDSQLDMRPGIAYEGVKTNVCWGGDVSRNQIVANAVGINAHKSVTVDIVEGNYISILGTAPTQAEYTYPDFPNTAFQGLTVGIAAIYADLHCRSNVIERAKVCMMGARESRIMDDHNYYEGSDVLYVYAIHTVSADLHPKYIHTPNAGLIWCDGSTAERIDIHLGDTSYFDLANLGVVPTWMRPPVLHNPTELMSLKSGDPGFIAFDPRFVIAGLDDTLTGVREIFVGAGGNDDNWGYSSLVPVATLQEAIDRCSRSSLNRIKVVSGPVGTKGSYRNGDTASSRKMEGLRLELVADSAVTLNVGDDGGELRSLPRGTSYFRASKVNINCTSPTGDYDGFICPLGPVDLILQDLTVTGACLIKPKPFDSGSANISMRVVTLSANTLTGRPASSNLAWIEASNDVTLSGGSIAGYDAGKIMSSTYP